MSGVPIGFKYYLKLFILALVSIGGIICVCTVLHKLFEKNSKSIKIFKIAVVCAIVICLLFAFKILHIKSDYAEYIPAEAKNSAKSTAELELENAKYSNEDIDVLKATADARLDNRLIIGALGEPVATISDFKELTTDEKKRIIVGEGINVNTLPATINRNDISVQDNEKIDQIYKGTLKNTYFNVYENTSNGKYYIYFYDKNNGFKHQLVSFARICFNYPIQVIKQYNENYWKIIFIKEGEFAPNERENFNITSKVYTVGIDNLVDVNDYYKEYISEYRSVTEENGFSKILNIYMNKVLSKMIAIMEIALWITPYMLISIGATYVMLKIKHKEISKEYMSLLQFIFILFGTTYMGIMSYIAFGTTVDRYVIPMSVTAFLAYFLTGVILVECIRKKICEKQSQKDKQR